MKQIITTLLLATLVVSCNKECGPCPGTVKMTYVHRYGVECTESDWEARGKSGQVITARKDGTVVTETYDHGELHGETSHTFPHSDVIATLETYDRGERTSLQDNHRTGSPRIKIAYKANDDRSIQTWYEDGTPRSREYYREKSLARGEYYTPTNALDSRITDGQGMRIVRNIQGQVVSEDVIVGGQMVKQSTYYPNGDPKTIVAFSDGEVHGTVRTFEPGGLPRTVEEWQHGEAHGLTTHFDNGQKVSEVTFAHGQKNGIEKRFNITGATTEEITWVEDVQHGPTRYFVDGAIGIDWYHRGNVVSKTTYDRLNGNMPM
jgi:antitoxin component YwqK of YwqJK toxin-antitoxin module